MPRPKRFRLPICLGLTIAVTTGMLAGPGLASAQVSFDVVHTFSGVEAPSVPRNLILAADGDFYGISRFSGSGAIARLTPAGRISIVHALTGAEGTDVTAFLQASDGNFYGATSDGGASGVGTVFRMTPAGTFTIVHDFSGRPSSGAPGDADGAHPRALLLAADGNFYGVTSAGGSTTYASGTFFRMTPTGTVSVLHSFTDNPSTLMQAADGTFYGGNGAYQLFKITSAGALTVLTPWVSLSFAGASGYSPSTLVEGADGYLYGTTSGTCVFSKVGSYCGPGTAFKVSPEGQVTILYAFATEGRPNAGLVQAGGAFYGTTSEAVFKMTSSGDVTVLHAFTGNAEEGSEPSRLVRSGDGNLYGTTHGTTYFAERSSSGSMFRFAADDTFTRIATSFSDGTADGAIPTAALLEGADSNFYGTTSAGGTFGLGTIFKLTGDGSLSVLHNFAGGADGASPYAALIQATDGNFYGTTYYGGGSANVGTIFRMTAAGAVTIVHRFAGGAEGAHPYAPLIQAADGSLYGTTFGFCRPFGCGGEDPGAGGTIFRMHIGGPVTTVRVLDATAEGFAPHAALVQGTDGNFYGSTTQADSYSGASFNHYGTIFRMMPDGAVTVLYAFGLWEDGAFPYGALVQGSDGNFYGATKLGGAKHGGTIFRITAAGSFTLLHSLDPNTDGASPEAPLFQGADGNLYGVTRRGAFTGTTTTGTIFQMTPAGNLALLHVFSGGPDGANPAGGLIQTTDGTLYGTATAGALGVGLVFRVRVTPQAPAFTTQPSNQTVKAGRQAVFTVAANGLPAPSYQWQVSTDNGGSWTSVTDAGWYSGTRTSNLSVTEAPRALDGYQFRAVATNTVGSATSSAAVLTVQPAAVTDMDGDGKADLAVFRPSDGNWFIRNSTTGYMTNTVVHWGLRGDVPAPGDYDGDGIGDLAVYRPATATWYIAQSTSSYTTSVSFQWGSPGDVPVPGDYDGDDMTDLAVYRPSTGVWHIVTSSRGYSTYPPMTVVALGLSTDIPVPADYDGDGKTDVAVYRPSTGTWYLRQSSTDAGLAFQWGLGGDVPVPGDYDGDGTTDLAVYRPVGGMWYIRQSTSNFTTSVSFRWGSSSDIAVPADYDGDSETDLAVYRPATGTWYISQSATNYTTSVSFQWGLDTDVATPSGPVAYAMAAAASRMPVSTLANLARASDFDGDGQSDLTVYRPFFGPSFGAWLSLRSSANYAPTPTSHFELGASTDLPVTGDFDGDGTTDGAVFTPATGVWSILRSSLGPFQYDPIQYRWGQNGDVPVPGDYDGDGRTDLAVYRPASGTWYISYSSANFTTFVSFQWGLSNDVPVPGDFDGDGKTDVAVYRASTGEWFIQQSTTADATFLTVQWGLIDDITVPGDYDGDGKTDVAVYRPSTGVWFIRQSTTSYATWVTYRWGFNDDIPVPGDFDGDGKTDVAVHRPSSGTWFLLLSGANFTTFSSYELGQPGDVPILKRP